jgi:SAM-dependent methyltransferase
MAEFLKSGHEHVGYVMDTVRAHVHRGFSPNRVLDFGCGVGRCLIPLARISKAVVGLDVSESMLEEARRNCRAQQVANAELAQSDDLLSGVRGTFDLIHSVFVFQNVPRKRGMTIFRRLTELLSEDGIGAIQFLFEREVSSIVKGLGILRKRVPLVHGLANLFYGRPLSEPLMEKNVYDLNAVIAILARAGCGNLHVSLFKEDVHQYCMLFFQKTRDRVPHEALARNSRVAT